MEINAKEMLNFQNEGNELDHTKKRDLSVETTGANLL